MGAVDAFFTMLTVIGSLPKSKRFFSLPIAFLLEEHYIEDRGSFLKSCITTIHTPVEGLMGLYE